MNKVVVWGQLAFIAAATIYFLGLGIFVWTDKFYVERYDTAVGPALGYSFLAIFILMAAANICLLILVGSDLRVQQGRKVSIFKREKTTLLTILFFYEISYLLRFLEDVCQIVDYKDDLFTYLIFIDVMFIFDGLSLLALLIFHFVNFKETQRTESTGSTAFTDKSGILARKLYESND